MSSAVPVSAPPPAAGAQAARPMLRAIPVPMTAAERPNLPRLLCADFMMCLSLPCKRDGPDGPGEKSTQALTLPAARPDCQKRWRNRNATMIGMIVSSDPVMTRL
jgi:hypothetical protein